MSRFIPFLIVLILTVMVAGRSARSGGSSASDFPARAAADEVLVGLRPEGLALTDGELTRRLGGPVSGRLDEVGAVRLGLEGGESPAAAVRRVESLPFVAYAEPDYRLRSGGLPNDPLFSGQGAYLTLIEAPSAWDIEEGNDAVIVAVLDSGIDVNHEDLQGKVWTNPLEIPDNGLDDDHDGCVDDVNGCGFVTPSNADPSCHDTVAGSVKDDNGHGTFVSGIVAARGHNAIGVIGAAPGVTVLPVKILDCLGGGTAGDAAAGLLYAAHVGARVANISFGADGESRTLANAIHEVASRYGMVVVAATGNEDKNMVTFPARLTDVIAVGSSGTPTDAGARSSFSSWGPEVAVVAPGQNIISTVPKQFCGLTWLCVNDLPYALASGTSFAAPLVSALAALIESHYPNLSAESVRQIIRATAAPLPDGTTPKWAGAGRIRMRAALGLRRYALGVAGLAEQP